MTAREVIVSRSVIESLAFAHPGLVVTFTAVEARCTHDGVTFVASLRPVAGAA